MINNHRFQILPPVVKNLLIINVLLFIATGILQSPPLNIDLTKILGLHYWRSELFSPWQIVSYMFMHGNIPHILFNMFAVWMFGTHIENRWGSKRFLNYYLLTGFGAAFLHYLIIHFQIINLESAMNYDQIMIILKEGIVPEGISRTSAQKLFFLYNTPVVGASGSLFGILLAFGVLFPNTLLYLYFAIPIKAKYFVIGYGLLELFSGLSNNPQDNVAHFAHLGGMLFGLLIFAYWKFKNEYY
ncbi:MAG: rhomboid family intramembrane serine protease [Flavobacteriales bacterium]|nr:rhomboid family intramembrane serine protease [Flavobacteriales bacterium]|tara:strand:- start:1919 stop:2647 length:729 start_codon:yes stop_codon:yes gene_type:complete